MRTGEVVKSLSDPSSDVFRLTWCPYVPDKAADPSDSEPDLASISSAGKVDPVEATQNMLVVWKGTRIHVLMVDTVILNKSAEVTFDELGLDDGHCVLEQEINQEITAAAISPDATALAVALADGNVKFFIFESLEQVKCAHSWKPHNGKPIETLIFLDNLKDTNPQDQFWKFALTASNGNRELKLFNCESWQCLGTLIIDAPANHTRDGWGLMLRVDPTGKFVYVADMERKSLYSIELDTTQPEDPCNPQQIRFASFTDFPLHKPILDMAVLSSARRKFRPFSPSEVMQLTSSDSYGNDEDDSVKNTVFGVQAIIYAINPRDLLKMEIRYQSREHEIVDKDSLSLNSSLDTQSTKVYDTSFSDISVENLKTNDEVQKSEETTRNVSAGSVTPTAKNSQIISSSPTSDEVTAILRPHSHDNGSNNVVVNEMDNDDRPVSPTVYTLESRDSVDEYDRKDSVVSQSWVADSRVDSMLAGVQKCNMELERVSAHLQKQADEVHVISRTSRSQEKNINHIKSQMESFSAQVSNVNDAKVSKGISESVQSMSQAIVNENKTRMKATENAILEQIPKFIESKPMTNAIANAVSESMAAQVQSTFSTILRQELLPAYDKALNNMFSQLNEVFNKGVKEYIHVVTEQSKNMYSNQKDQEAAILNHVSNVTDQMRVTLERNTSATADQMAKQVDQMKQVVNSANAGMQANMQAMEKNIKAVSENVRGIVREEVLKCMKDNQSQIAVMTDSVQKLIRSQTCTPNSVASVAQQDTKAETQRQIVALIAQKDYNQAFQLALSMCDLHILMFACSKVDARVMFAQETCPLTQPVVLSLLQQLATDLSTHAETKLSFVEECLLALDTRSADIKSHWRDVATAVKELLLKFQSRTSPTSALGRQVKRCLIAITGIME